MSTCVTYLIWHLQEQIKVHHSFFSCLRRIYSALHLSDMWILQGEKQQNEIKTEKHVGHEKSAPHPKIPRCFRGLKGFKTIDFGGLLYIEFVKKEKKIIFKKSRWFWLYQKDLKDLPPQHTTFQISPQIYTDLRDGPKFAKMRSNLRIHGEFHSLILTDYWNLHTTYIVYVSRSWELNMYTNTVLSYSSLLPY